jgi:hypothetical protein
MTNYWQVQEAKAKFSRLMDRAMRHGRNSSPSTGEPRLLCFQRRSTNEQHNPTKASSSFSDVLLCAG